MEPSDFGSRGSTTPFPMKLSATGIPVARTNSRSAGAAPPRTTPLPARAIGFKAPRITSAAFSSSRAAGAGRPGRVGSHGPLAGARLPPHVGRHDIFRELDVGRTRLLRLGHLEGLAHDLGD